MAALVQNIYSRAQKHNISTRWSVHKPGRQELRWSGRQAIGGRPPGCSGALSGYSWTPALCRCTWRDTAECKKKGEGARLDTDWKGYNTNLHIGANGYFTVPWRRTSSWPRQPSWPSIRAWSSCTSRWRWHIRSRTAAQSACPSLLRLQRPTDTMCDFWPTRVLGTTSPVLQVGSDQIKTTTRVHNISRDHLGSFL